MIRWTCCAGSHSIPPADSIIYIGHEKHPRHPDVARVVAATRRLPNFSADGLPSPAAAAAAAE